MTPAKGRRAVKIGLLLVAVPLLVLLGVTVLRDRSYNLISIAIAFISCLPFFINFERRQNNTRRMVVIAVMVALTVVGRLIFSWIPFFKPVTAITVITAIHFGPDAGFLTGALSAIISNIYAGQGPWTPFQMFTWGLLGFVAGRLAGPLKRSKVLLCLYGIVAGFGFSCIMDIWVVFDLDGTFNWPRYLAALATAQPVILIYCLSNVVFLLALGKPIGSKLERVKLKYGL